MAFAADALGDRFVVQTVKGEQNHTRSLGEALGTSAGAGHGGQDILLPLRNNDFGCPPWH